MTGQSHLAPRQDGARAGVRRCASTRGVRWPDGLARTRRDPLGQSHMEGRQGGKHIGLPSLAAPLATLAGVHRRQRRAMWDRPRCNSVREGGQGLPGRVLYDHGVPVHDDRVVNVVGDDVDRWRRDIDGPVHPDGQWRVLGCRKDELLHRGRWRRQIDDVCGRRWQHHHGWGRREVELGERKHGLVDDVDLVQRRRGHIIVDRCKFGRRLQGCVQSSEPATAIGGVRAPRIATQIGPVGVSRPDLECAPPC